MSQYRKIDARNLEQNFYLAFVENLHSQMIMALKENKILSESVINLLAVNIKCNLSEPIMTEIKKFKTPKKT